MPQNFIVDLHVYPFDIMVSIDESDEVLFKQLKDVNIPIEEISKSQYEPNGVGRYCLFEGGQSLIRMKKTPLTPFEFGILQHEIFHCATALLWKMNVKFKMKVSDEAYAYLIQYITEAIYNHVLKLGGKTIFKQK